MQQHSTACERISISSLSQVVWLGADGDPLACCRMLLHPLRDTFRGEKGSRVLKRVELTVVGKAGGVSSSMGNWGSVVSSSEGRGSNGMAGIGDGGSGVSSGVSRGSDGVSGVGNRGSVVGSNGG